MLLKSSHDVEVGTALTSSPLISRTMSLKRGERTFITPSTIHAAILAIPPSSIKYCTNGKSGEVILTIESCISAALGSLAASPRRSPAEGVSTLRLLNPAGSPHDLRLRGRLPADYSVRNLPGDLVFARKDSELGLGSAGAASSAGIQEIP